MKNLYGSIVSGLWKRMSMDYCNIINNWRRFRYRKNFTNKASIRFEKYEVYHTLHPDNTTKGGSSVLS